MAYNRASEKDNAPEMIERVVYLNRVSKTVKGGRVMVLRSRRRRRRQGAPWAMAWAEAAEVSEAILKRALPTRKNLQKVVLAETTIPTKSSASLAPVGPAEAKAPVGTGVLVSGAVRAVMEAAGISNIRASACAPTTRRDVVKATMQGLLSLRGPEERSLASAAKTSEEIVG